MNKSDKKFILKLFKIKNGNINLLKNRITHFSINNKCIHIVLCNNTLIKYYVEENELSYIDFYNKKTTNNKAEIRSIYFDNNCYHGFICLANKEYIYVHFENNIIKNLLKLKKYNIKCLCFNNYSEIKNTYPFVIGTKNGEIIEMCISNKAKNKEHEVIFCNENLSILDINMLNININETNEILRIIYFTTSNCLHELSYIIKNNKIYNSEKNESNFDENKNKEKNFIGNSGQETKVYESCIDSLCSILKIENIKNKNYLFWLNGCCIFISKINNHKEKVYFRDNCRKLKYMNNKTFDYTNENDYFSYSSSSDDSYDDIDIISFNEEDETKEKNKKYINKKKKYRNNYFSKDEEYMNKLNKEFYLDSNYIIVNFLDLNIFTNDNINSSIFTKSFYKSMNYKFDKISDNSNDYNFQKEKNKLNENTNELMNYEKKVSTIIDMCINNFYIFLLLEEKLIIINNVNFKKVYEQTLSIETYGQVIRIMKDNFDDQVWLSTSKYIFKILINKNNNNDMIYLHLKKRNYKQILESGNNSEKVKIKKYLLKNNKYALDQYKYTQTNNEEMLISFLHKKQYFLLSNFLYNNIHCFNNIVRIALFIWLIQLYVYSIDLYNYLYCATSYHYSPDEKKKIISYNQLENSEDKVKQDGKELNNFSDESKESLDTSNKSIQESDEFLEESDEYLEESDEFLDESNEFLEESNKFLEGSNEFLEAIDECLEKEYENFDHLSDSIQKSSETLQDSLDENHKKLNKNEEEQNNCYIEAEKKIIKKEPNIKHISNAKNIEEQYMNHLSDKDVCLNNFDKRNYNNSNVGSNNNSDNNRKYCTNISSDYNTEIKKFKENYKYLKNNKNSFILFFEKLINEEEKKEYKNNFDFSKEKKINIKTLTESDNFYILLKIYKMKNVEIFSFLKNQWNLIMSEIEKYKKCFSNNNKYANYEKDYIKIKKKLYKHIYTYKCLEVCCYIIILIKHFKNFFQLNEVVFDIFQSFNKINFLLLYKFINNDYNYIIKYYINNNKYNLLFNVIILFPQNVLLDVLREHAFILFLHKPQRFVDLLIFYDNLIDDYSNIIICMFIIIFFFKNYNKNEEKKQKKNSKCNNIYLKHFNACIKFLEYASDKLIEENILEKKENYVYTFECTWKNNYIINCLLILYIEKDENEKIKNFLNRLKSASTHFDYLFIIRFLKEKNKENFIPHIYILMKYYEEAVEKALELNDYKIAKSAVLLCDDEEEKKKLFLKIIKHVSKNLNDKNLKEIINLVRDSNSILNLHDILPYINENTIIEYLKKDICSLLGTYNLKIKAKKEEIKENLQRIELLNKDIKNVRKKHIVLDKNDICFICKKTIYYKKFYVFSCNHYFHSVCALNIYLNSKSKEELFQFFSILHHYKNSLINQEDKDTLIYEMKIDDILTEECFICGSFSINSVFQNFICQNEYELIDSWSISKD
ncbi:vacuolar protein sorting-associated protein 18, putative [Plasmodium gallinaceum]|uniref:Vacuolar protein sorting-associated protein 18, putative n=1 Tax=Plasmodium gallinaceum TaxID=5849 RepID=A0A1J1GYE5_PLAGA|nr:vacuolar protein sorting-associated protein 18, putative [Plasmodium gallinaceum]CRG97485.1 vacuolar protein sorting-associated protein 18, putative [Plasmodium gallinaceum]